jgi:hypothetical protein
LLFEVSYESRLRRPKNQREKKWKGFREFCEKSWGKGGGFDALIQVGKMKLE